MNTLKVIDLEKKFHTRRVVNKVSIELHQGEIVGLLGPNGAGKTTAFYMVLGLVASDGGKISLNDQDISSLSIHERARLGIGYLPQEASIFRKLSVTDNILAILQLRGDLTRRQQKEKLASLLHEFHIDHIAKSIGYKLSGGERRRVEIARCLAMEPKFILLDEPFAGIDPISVIDIKHIIRHLCERGIGVLITDHNVRETLDICDRAYILNCGEIICSGDSATILKNELVRKVYLGDDFEL
ncbi:MAG TPA: LPS export ABC transporter ATP-binding protein [Coxiellaceae bacterium]|nr:LPS export ABC transporter ATP-binding protein [Coxiellaceae bacterium]